jgi:HK97 family phage prohead protease
MQLERKDFTFNPTSFEIKQDGDTEVGIIEGYASTWDTDLGNDQILKGAFLETIKEYEDGERNVPAKYMHDPLEIIGGLPPASMYEDDEGLFVSMQVNFKVARGRECYELVKQRVLKRFSIGYYAVNVTYDSGVRIIPTIKLVEISLVDHPMNLGAVVTGVKGFTEYLGLPLADPDYKFDPASAIKRVREHTNSINEPTQGYGDAFFYNYGWQGQQCLHFDDYVLMYADVIDGELKAVKQAVEAAYYSLKGVNGGTWISNYDVGFVKENINRYLLRFNSDLSFDLESKNASEKAHKFDSDCVSQWRERELESFLKSSKILNKKDIKCIISNIKKSAKDELELKQSIENLLVQMKV